MPSNLPPRNPHLPDTPNNPFNLEQHAAAVMGALTSDDPALISTTIKEIGTLRRIPVVLDENPRLSEVLRALRDLGLGLVVRPLASLD